MIRGGGTFLAPSLAVGSPAVYYQPQIDLQTGSVCAVEALARWEDPELDLLQPAEFLPLIEDAFMMKWLTATVTSDVIDQLASWAAPGRAQRVAVRRRGGAGGVSICIATRRVTPTSRRHPV